MTEKTVDSIYDFQEHNEPHNVGAQSQYKLLNEIGIVLEVRKSETAGEEATIVVMTLTKARKEVKA